MLRVLRAWAFIEGPLKDCTKFPKPNKQYKPPARVRPHWLFVLRSRPCSPEGGVKAPAVKPCIVYITLLPCSVGSKELRAKRIIVVQPHCKYNIGGWPAKIHIIWSKGHNPIVQLKRRGHIIEAQLSDPPTCAHMYKTACNVVARRTHDHSIE